MTRQGGGVGTLGSGGIAMGDTTIGGAATIDSSRGPVPAYRLQAAPDARTSQVIGTSRQTAAGDARRMELRLGGRVGHEAGYPSRGAALDVLKSLPASAVIEESGRFWPYLLEGPGVASLRTDDPEMVLPDSRVSAVLQSGRHLWVRERPQDPFDQIFQQHKFGGEPAGDDTFVYDRPIVATEIPFTGLDAWVQDSRHDVLSTWQDAAGGEHRLAPGELRGNPFGYANLDDAIAAARKVSGDAAVVRNEVAFGVRGSRYLVTTVMDLDAGGSTSAGGRLPPVEVPSSSMLVALSDDGEVVARGPGIEGRRNDPRPSQPYASWQVERPADGAPIRSLDLVMTPRNDPGAGAAYFASHQFGLDHGNGGYIGLQTDEQGKRAIFSIWDAAAASGPGKAQPFGGEGVGYQTMIPFDWQAGRSYRLRVWQNPPTEQGSTVVAFVKDMTTGTELEIGAIDLQPGRGGFRPESGSWIESYGPERPHATDYPPFEVDFEPPVANEQLPGLLGSTYTGKRMVASSSERQPDGSVRMQINAEP